MLNCEQCNYLNHIDTKDERGRYYCDLTEFIFNNKDQFKNMTNHPCDSYHYDEGQLLNC